MCGEQYTLNPRSASRALRAMRLTPSTRLREPGEAVGGYPLPRVVPRVSRKRSCATLGGRGVGTHVARSRLIRTLTRLVLIHPHPKPPRYGNSTPSPPQCHYTPHAV